MKFETNSQFIEFIKSERRNQHITQIELANKCGLNQQHISLIETGKVVPSLSVAIRILAALGYIFIC